MDYNSSSSSSSSNTNNDLSPPIAAASPTNIRCTLNSAAQLAATIKPVFDYDERKIMLPSSNTSVFEARCMALSRLKELEGLILYKEARGASIKAAREGAAAKVRQHLLAKDVPKAP